MRELPLFGVIGRTIAFEVVNLFTLFRLTWLPLAALIAAQYGLAAWLLSQLAADVPYATVQGFYVFIGYIWVIIILQVIALTAVAVRVHRLALFGDRHAGHYFVFPFGATEVRYVIMGILSSLIVSVPTAVIAYLYYASRMKVTDTAIAALLAAPSAPLTTQGNGWLNLAVAFAIIVFLIWLGLRLSVWPAAVVANNRLALGDAWRTTRGQALPLLLMFILFYILLIIAIVAIQIAFISYLPGLVGDTPPTKDDPVMTDVLQIMVASITPNALLMEFVTQFLLTTSTVAILSFAYRALKTSAGETAPDETSDDDDPVLHMR